MSGWVLRTSCALLMIGALSGCVAVLAGTAGALIVDEGIIENDGEFDPFENTELGRALWD
ncbi:MAG: hypothetical protein AAGD13_05720 [Pseudomonadota bacterium]